MGAASATGSITGVSALIASIAVAGASVAIAGVSVAGEIDGESTCGSSLLIGAAAGVISGFAAASPPVISMSLRLAMAGPHIGCLPIANHVRLPICYQLRADAPPARLASRRVTPTTADKPIFECARPAGRSRQPTP